MQKWKVRVNEYKIKAALYEQHLDEAKQSRMAETTGDSSESSTGTGLASIVEAAYKLIESPRYLYFDYLPGKFTTKSPWNVEATQQSGAVRNTNVFLTVKGR